MNQNVSFQFQRNFQFRLISKNTNDLLDGINFHRFESNAQSFDPSSAVALTSLWQNAQYLLESDTLAT